jgi:hypothetical protein
MSDVAGYVGAQSATSSRSRPTGPGSRGGRWHDPEYRREYARAWRAAHPEYRERERLRRARAKAGVDMVTAPSYPRPLPEAAKMCACSCGCRESVATSCGFCRDGQHQEDAA